MSTIDCSATLHNVRTSLSYRHSTQLKGELVVPTFSAESGEGLDTAQRLEVPTTGED